MDLSIVIRIPAVDTAAMNMLKMRLKGQSINALVLLFALISDMSPSSRVPGNVMVVRDRVSLLLSAII